jgi:uncharacterized protein DUF4124
MAGFRFKLIAFFAVLLVVSMQPAMAKKMYRWVDEDGRIFFSDQIPQDQIQHKRESLNQDARVLEVVEEARTQEQIELEKRLKQLRWEQEKIIAKQKSQDKVLLSTFRNVDDMKMALKGKMAAMDAQRKVADGNLLRLELQLEQQQKQAANYERNGQRVPAKLLTEILASKDQIENANLEILRHLEKKIAVKREFQTDIDRFVFLTQSKKDSNQLSNKTAESTAANELGLFICENERQCDRAWKVARRFVEENSSTAADIDTDKLIMRASPRDDTDLSLSVSRVGHGGERHQIFLDIRCRKSTLGVELCASDAVKDIRRSFSRYIEYGLASEQ